MLEKIHPHLECLSCKVAMQRRHFAMQCGQCGKMYHFIDNKLVVVPGTSQKVVDPLDKLKLRLKPFSRLYNLLIKVISPVYVDGSLTTFITHNLSKDGIYCNLGSGNMRLHKDIINVDFIAYPNVDVVADIAEIPLARQTCDGIFIIGTLEHVPDPCRVIAEIHRLLKKGGFVYAFFPFMQGYHASPHDYFRTTQQGAKNLFHNFNEIEIKPAGGPTSALLWIFQEWLAMVLSIGIKPLYYFWFIFLMCVTFPIKFLDIILIHHPMASHITS